MTFAGCGYVIVEYETIMGSLPTAGTLDIALTTGLVLAILEVSRRAIGGIFPTIVLLGIAYALLGHLLPGKLGHRGFDMEFVTETLLLGDLGIWGLLVGVAATTIGAFILFGSALLFTGGGQTFMDLAVRVSGRSPGGAAKVATVASGLFGMISGSAVANVATTGNFTIPLMKRLGYPAPLAGGIEAVASTGGQIAPPVMGAAAFVMAEIIGRSYFDIAVAAALPAFLFYLGCFATVHLIARERGLRVVPESEMPPWSDILTARRIAPILAAFGGLFYGILTGRSVQTAAFFGVAAMLVPYVALNIRSGSDLRTVLATLVGALEDAGKALVMIGVLLAGAQTLVAMVNLTGLGVALSSVAHMFVFYYATISTIITPPVCIAVFVAAGIAQTGWVAVAREACKLGAVTYVIPFMFIAYPGMLAEGGTIDFLEACVSGTVFTLAFANLFAGVRYFQSRLLTGAILLAIALLAALPTWYGLLVSTGGLVVLYTLRRHRIGAASTETLVTREASA